MWYTLKFLDKSVENESKYLMTYSLFVESFLRTSISLRIELNCSVSVVSVFKGVNSFKAFLKKKKTFLDANTVKITLLSPWSWSLLSFLKDLLIHHRNFSNYVMNQCILALNTNANLEIILIFEWGAGSNPMDKIWNKVKVKVTAILMEKEYWS